MLAKQTILSELQGVVKELTDLDITPHLEHPTEPTHGDYSTNIALQVFGQVKTDLESVKTRKFAARANNPMEMAQKIVDALTANNPLHTTCDRIEVAKPGFINFFLSPKLLASEVVRCIKEEERYGQSKISNKKIVIEHTSPNTNKPLHVGHIRNNVLSMAVVRLLQAVGNEVYPVEIINDRGVHICKSMMGYLFTGTKKIEDQLKNLTDEDRAKRLQIMQESEIKQGKFSSIWQSLLNDWTTSPQKWVTPEELGVRGDHFVGRYYVDSTRLEERFTNYGDYLQGMLQAWEAGDEKVRELWQQMNAWFYQGVEETYERLGSLESRRWFESEVYQEGKDIVEQNIGKVFIRQEDGSVIANLEKYKLPNCVVLRSDGTAIYMTQDIALLKDRKEKLKADELIYVVANEQALHFKQLFAIATELGYGEKDDFYHLSYGMVRLTTGPMSSRLGTVVNADDLMDQAVKKAREVIERAKISKNIDDPEKLAEQVGIGAIKYTMSSYHPAGDIIFDPDKSVSFDGDSGPYLQYTHARTQSILQKSDFRVQISDSDIRDLISDNLKTEELAVLRYLYRFPEVVQDAGLNYSPNLLCNFLFELAQRYNTFYNKHRILGSRGTTETFRLALTQATGTILKAGLNLLGISAPERM